MLLFTIEERKAVEIDGTISDSTFSKAFAYGFCESNNNLYM